MSKRGRPPYPDILTPRGWEVLALIREGLTNEEIAARLGISVDGAKYHVAEILSKLGVSSRQEAARWRPEERPWWLAAGAPLAALWRSRLASWPVLALALAVPVILGAVAGLVVVAVLVWRSSGDSPAAPALPTALAEAAIPTATPAPAWFWGAGWHLDAENGWLADRACPSNETRDGCVGLIHRTQDGGATWEEQYRGDLRIYLMQFADAQTGWAVGSALSCDDGGMTCPGALLTTTDGGSSWSRVYTSSGHIDEVSLTESDGWLLTHATECTIGSCENVLLRSTDGGLTWSASILPLGGSYLSLSRPSVNDAWMASGADVAVTHDAGETWALLPGSGLPDSASWKSAIFFLPSGQGWLLVGDGATGGTQPKALFGTSDGGLTWHHVSGSLYPFGENPTPIAPGELGSGGYVGELYFTSPQNGWLTLARAGLLHTTDGGATWESLFYDDSAGALQFSDPEHGWAIFSIVPQATSDGVSWAPIDVPHAVP